MEGHFLSHKNFFALPLIITSVLCIFKSGNPPNMINNVQAYNLLKSGSEKCVQMYYLLESPFIVAEMTAIRF